MTTYHTFPVDNLPPPSDIELEDRRMREDWTRVSDAIGAAEERRNRERRHYEFDKLMNMLDCLTSQQPDWMREAAIEAEDVRDQRNTQQDALGVLF